jgi:hypothetical protein
VKDNIATHYEHGRACIYNKSQSPKLMSFAGMNTTAGSYALLDSVVLRNSFIVDQLLTPGAIILGKSNMVSV